MKRAARALVRLVFGRGIDALDRRTRAARARDAATRLFVGGAKPTDIVWARLYFGAAALHWGGLSQAPDHLESFEAGLARCGEPQRVLDIGTGAGGSAALIARTFPAATVVGVDVSRAMVAEAQRRHSQPNLEFRRASARRTPFGDGEFDLVTVHNAIPELHELRRLLAPGARVLSASTFSPLAERTHAERGRWRDFGLVLREAEDVARGAWEVYELDGDAGPAPLI